MNLHFKNPSEDKIDPSTTPERHDESNIQHEFFIGFYKDLRKMLVTKPTDSTNVPIDPEKARIAVRMRSVLKNMHTMTDDVMNAWKEYRSKRLSSSQTTLITHAAVERAQALESNFLEGKAPGEKQTIQELYSDHNPKLVETTREPRTDLDYDLRALFKPPFAPIKSDTFEKSMEILHFPPIYVLSNFQGMSELLNHEYPVLQVLSDVEKASREAKLELKSRYKDQVGIIWHFLNEILFLHRNPLDKYQRARFFGILRESPGAKNEDISSEASKETEKIFLPSDIFSKALSEVIENPGKIAMSTSFVIQLLAKI
ncbi:hypothetical protein IWZ03DRAFT_412481 [Phyllosticta citriasiana]|uniref:Uncharacterized protein n=1 Tax=Phyllosticta citriasiana TaxID=595635 RepID=A0ABR1KXG4_9PEZI